MLRSVKLQESVSEPEFVYSANSADIPQPESRKEGLGSAVVAFLFYVALITLYQHLTGSAKASFGLYPDEPSHYLSCVLVRDYLLSGFHKTPLAFATDYYASLPFFAIGYWPPAFYAIGGLWMMLFGVARESALSLTTACAALIAVTIFQVARRWSGTFGALLWGLIFLLIPQVGSSASMFMLDLPVTLFSFWSLLALLRFYHAPHRAAYAVLFGVLASLTILTKYSGGFLCMLPAVLVLGTRKFSLLRNRFFWLQAVIVLAICSPWLLATRKILTLGLPPGGHVIHQSALVALKAFSVGIVYLLGPVLTVAALVGIAVLFAAGRWTVECLMYAAAPVCVVLFLTASPVGVEGRYLLPAVPPVILLLSYVAASLAKTAGRIPALATPALLLIAAAGQCALAFPHYTANPVRPFVDFLSSDPRWKGASILLPADWEGPAIVDFAMRDPHRPSYQLLRPSKVLAEAGWSEILSLNYRTPAELQQKLIQNSVHLIVIDRSAGTVPTALDTVISGVVEQFPAYWSRIATLGAPPSGPASAKWDIYAVSQPLSAGSGVKSESDFRSKTLIRLNRWKAPAR